MTTGWEEVRLGSLGQIYGGLSGKTKNDFGRGDARYVPFMSVMSNVAIEQLDLPSVEVAEGEAQNSVATGDLLFNGSSETPDELAMCSVVVRIPERTYLNSFCFGFRLASNALVEPFFLAYLFRSDTGRQLLRTLAQGATRYNLSKAQFRNLTFRLPSLREQRRIVAALSEADALIDSLERLVAKKRAIRHGAMQQLLSGRTRLAGFDGAWAETKVDAIVRRERTGGHKIEARCYQEVGAVPIVDQGPRAIAGYTDRASLTFDPPPGGVVVFGDHTCIVKFVDFPFAVGADGTQVLRARGTSCEARWLSYALDGKIAPTGYNRHIGMLMESVLFLPPIEEQRAISQILSDADAEVAVLKARLAKTRDVKQGIMQELLTGRTRLPILDAAAQQSDQQAASATGASGPAEPQEGRDTEEAMA